MAERTAVYPGSFDPPTLGHLDLINRAARIFDRVIVAVARNHAKNAMFTVDERMEMLRELTAKIGNVEIDSFQGLTVDYASERGAVALIRGLRVISDFEFELSLAINNQKLRAEIDTVCLMPSEPFLFLSSRQVKEIASFGGKIAHYVTPEVGRRVYERCAPQAGQ